MKEKVLITGGSGLVGKQLTQLLVAQGYEVGILSRSKKENTKEVTYYQWDIAKGKIDTNVIFDADYIIHLAGENVAKSRWTKKQKTKILESRTLSTRLLYSILSKNEDHQVKAFISASATGYYGTEISQELFTEDATAGSDFLAGVCRAWEASVAKIATLGIRTVKLRTGVVFGKEGSALQKMLPPFRLGLGSAIGSGQQFMPWIHIEDLCKMYLFAIENSVIEGNYNAVVGDKMTNKIVSKSIAEKLNKPFFMPNVPAFLLQIIFGEMAVILLKGNCVSAEKIKKEGFKFEYPTIEKALDNLLS